MSASLVGSEMCIRDRFRPMRIQSMQNRIRRSKLELRDPGNDLKLHSRGSRPGGSASFCALSPMVATKRAGGRAGGASRG
eukprot:6772848-Alexandrium_andersonii.AAC.1